MIEYIEKAQFELMLDEVSKMSAYSRNTLSDLDIVKQIRFCVKHAKAADVQPVIHAHWIELPKAMNPNENPCKCSNCGHVLSFMNHYPKSNYCPNCGANMRGE